MESRRRRRSRPTVRRLMAAVLLAALGLGLGLPAYEEATLGGPHRHLFLAPDRNSPSEVDLVDRPFWPRYARRLLGRPPRRPTACPVGPHRPDELCEIEDALPFLPLDSLKSLGGMPGGPPGE